MLILMTAIVLVTPWRNEAPAALYGGPLVIAAMLVLIRWLRWQPWRCLSRPDLLLPLGGYL